MERLRREDDAVERIVASVGPLIRLATPLGLGKPNHLLNALYRRVKAEPRLRLEIYTALTLERPKGRSELERRLLGPLVERLFGSYPDLDYELDRTAGALPPNVRVHEFYFPAGKYLGNAAVQRDYISTNYTYVARDLVERGVNVLAQQVAVGTEAGAERLSLSCNPDVTLDMLALLRARRAAGERNLFVAQRNDQLPFMYGDALVAPDSFDLLIDAPERSYTLFVAPKEPVGDAEYMIGLAASALIRDGGELQIGIGALGDAIAYALRLRQTDNRLYRRAIDRLRIRERCGALIERLGGLAPFEQGLFAATEMVVDGFQHLIDAGIVKRRVYDDLALQRLLNEGRIGEAVTPRTLEQLLEAGAIRARLTQRDFDYLVHFGVLRAGLRFESGTIRAPGAEPIPADLADPAAFARLCQVGLGSELARGAVIHGGFFLGPGSFYQWLRDLPEAQRRRIDMRSVGRINQLYGHEAIDRLHRRDARFLNAGLLVTLTGAVASDALEDGRVVSGVGGQYNFVAMAHALPGGRSVLQIRATRHAHGRLHSNVVASYGHTTIPRHLRDLIVTEYGIADLRGRTDEEVIRELLAISDSRFQGELLAQAKAHGKLDPQYTLPESARANLPEAYAPALAELRREGLFPAYPFGTELTREEVVLARTLRRLQARIESTPGLLEAVGEAVVDGATHGDVLPYLERMGLAEPRTLNEAMYQRLLAAELRHDAALEPHGR